MASLVLNGERRERMLEMKKLIATSLVVLAATVAASAAPAANTPVSPGGCHMLEANANGLAGMDGSQGGKNMVPLVVASLGAGCTP
jgi:hypothetical protein